MKTKKKAIRRILSFSSLESRDTSIPIEGVKEHSKVTKRKCPSPDIGAGHSLVNSISKKVCCSQTLATGVVPDKLQQLSTNATNTSIPIEGVKQHGIVTKRKCAPNDIGGSHSLVNSVSKKICCSQTFASKVVPDELRPISTDAISGDLHANQIAKKSSASNVQQRRRNARNTHPPSVRGPPTTYIQMGQCNCICQHCRARFWLQERIKRSSLARPQYNRCCNEGQVQLEDHDNHDEYPEYIKQLFTNRHFMENIRAYNQMFAMTSLGAEIDDSVNRGRGPYVFKISGQLYHWIGTMCPEQGKRPKFLQLYIYDTQNEVANRLEHFRKSGHALRPDIVANLIEVLDEHNELVRLFRTARDKMEDPDIPEFKVRLFGVVGSRQHELPSGDSVGAIVFEGGPDAETDFDVVIHKRDALPQRINKLHRSYMSFQFPLIFIFGEDGYHLERTLLTRRRSPSDPPKKMTMKMYYAYQLHDR